MSNQVYAHSQVIQLHDNHLSTLQKQLTHKLVMLYIHEAILTIAIDWVPVVTICE